MSEPEIDRLEARLGAPPRTVLLIGEGARWEVALRSRGWDVRIATPAQDFGLGWAGADAIVSERVLATDPWDRWALQRMHRALRPGGRLLLIEPNMLDLSTPAGIRYAFVRGLQLALRRVRRILKPTAAPRATLVGRRPEAGRLCATLSNLRFTVEAVWYERSGGWAPLLPARLAPRVGVIACALPSIAGLADPWPERKAHIDRYEHAQSKLLAIRERWMRDHSNWLVASLTGFVPADYAGRTVVVLAPHPDDEVIGAAGAMLELVRAGARVVCVHATDGSAGAAMEGMPEAERRDARLREAQGVGDRIGVASLELWRADNRDFRADPEFVKRMEALLARERPALVFLPFVTEDHADHITLTEIFARALSGLSPPLDALVLGYEVWSVVPPTHVLDVTARMSEIEDLLFRYDLAMRVDDFVRFCADRALYHGWQEMLKPAYFEAYHAVHARDYPELLRTVRPAV